MKLSLSKRATSTVVVALCALGVMSLGVALAATKPLKKGLTAFVIPKNLGNNYFTVSDSAKSGGAIAAWNKLGEKGSETSGTAATPASQQPAITAAIAKGAKILLLAAPD